MQGSYDIRRLQVLTYNLSERGDVPLYEALYEFIRRDIKEGRLRDDERLPSKRALARNLGVSITTVENAYSKLMDDGYIRSKPASGFFVEKSDTSGSEAFMRDVSVHGAFYASAAGGIDNPAYDTDIGREILSEESEDFSVDFKGNRCSLSLFPIGTWTRLMRQVISESEEELFNTIPYAGLESLRVTISEHLRGYRGIEVSPQQVVIGAGTEFLYQRVLELFGASSVVAFEDPGYKKLTKVCERTGLMHQYVPVDDEGLDIGFLERSHANIAHVSPANHFPTGAVMSLERRVDILNWAAQSPMRYIIEDDYDCEFASPKGNLLPLYSMDRNGKVIYMNTFSKVLVPSIRISYMILPMALIPLYRRSMGFYSCTASGFEQRTLAKFIADGYLERHLNRLKNYYSKKRGMLLRAIRESGLSGIAEVSGTGAGTHMLVGINTDLNDAEVHRRAGEKHIRLSMLSDYCWNPRVYDLHKLVINYAGMESDDIERAIHALEEIFL